MIRVINGDLLSCGSGITGHQVNCKRVMGSGVAKQIKDKYSVVYAEYRKTDMELGKCQIVKINDGLFVANLFGQETYGKFGTHTNYEALEKALDSMMQFAKESNLECNLPYAIGCGLGGGDWAVVEKIIESLSNKHSVIVNIYKYNRS